jgi:hypothetical protein
MFKFIKRPTAIFHYFPQIPRAAEKYLKLLQETGIFLKILLVITHPMIIIIFNLNQNRF